MHGEVSCRLFEVLLSDKRFNGTRKGSERLNTIPKNSGELFQYENDLIALGYSKRTIWKYVNGARQYLRSGKPLDEEVAVKYWREQRELDPNLDYNGGRTGTLKYIQWKRTGKVTKSRKKYKGCIEDCFNCEYEDCLKPDNMCREVIEV